MKIDNFTNFNNSDDLEINEDVKKDEKMKKDCKDKDCKDKDCKDKVCKDKDCKDKVCKDKVCKDKRIDERKIKNFSELIAEKELHNELPNNMDSATTIKVAGAKNNMKTAPTIKGISVFLDDVKTNILSCCKDKGVAMSTYKISGNVGIDVKDVHNVLENLEKKGKITKKIIGKEEYWTAK